MRLGMRIEKILGRLVPDPALGLYSIVYSTVLLYTAVPCTRLYAVLYTLPYTVLYTVLRILLAINQKSTEK